MSHSSQFHSAAADSDSENHWHLLGPIPPRPAHNLLKFTTQATGPGTRSRHGTGSTFDAAAGPARVESESPSLRRGTCENSLRGSRSNILHASAQIQMVPLLRNGQFLFQETVLKEQGVREDMIPSVQRFTNTLPACSPAC
jgi:hypothetical protein